MSRWTTFLTHTVPLSGMLFALRLRSRTRRTLLGHLWLIIPAAMTCLLASMLRDRGALTVDVPGMPYAVFVLAGMSFWQIFLDALNAPLQQMSQNRQIVTRVRFPHEALLLVGLWDTLLNAALRLAALLLVCLVLRIPPAAGAVWIPVVACVTALLGLGFGMLLVPFGLLYEDVGRALPMMSMLLFFVMPVAYPLEPIGWERFNPVLPLINAGRAALIGWPAVDRLWMPVLLAAIAWLVAVPLNRLARSPLIERLG